MGKRLGKGLNILMSKIDTTLKEGEKMGRFEIELVRIRPNPFQPRKEFDSKQINELAQSIKENGLLQPIIVRKRESIYEIIAGERRFRAIKSLGWQRVPCIVYEDISDEKMLQLALCENLQRDDLNPIEKAMAFKEMSERFNLTQEEIAKRIGVDRSTIANFIRLLSLPEEIKQAVSRGTITMGHARALLSLKTKEEKLELYRRIIANSLSVRVTERIASGSRTRSQRPKSLHIKELEERLKLSLGTYVEIQEGKRKSKLIINFYGKDDLNRILKIMGVSL